jgi:hypothetical protein
VELLLLLAKLLLLLAGLILPLAGLLLLLLDWQLLLAWLMLLQLLLLEELLLLSFLPPRPPSCIFAILASKRWPSPDCPKHSRAEGCYRRSQCAHHLGAFHNPVWSRCL